jgi:hypothetical protein
MKAVKKAPLKISQQEIKPADSDGRWSGPLTEQAHAFSETTASGKPPWLIMQSKTMKLKKRQCWNLPSGFHQAKIVSAQLIKSATKDELELRLIFEIISLAHPTKIYVAKRVYRIAESETIIDDLEHLLNGKVEQVVNLSGEIIPEALVLLVGKNVDIEVEHHRGKNHDEPFCLVTKVKQQGVLIEVIKEAA